MIKEGLEDAKRHTSDREVNNRMCPVLQPDGSTVDVLWRDVGVGSLIKVVNKGEVPADIIVLQTSEPKGVCYVETSQIDGETNLKLKEALGATATACDSDAQLGALSGDIVYDTPNDRIHHFTGKLRSSPGGAYAPVGAKNMVLRGCTVRNTRWLVGLVVYTGRETKVMKKSGGARSKMSQVEQTMNTCIKIVFAAQAALCIVTDIGLALWNRARAGQFPYLRSDSVERWLPEWLGQLFTYLLLFNNFIPISLYITVEVVNYAQAFLVDADGAMYCDECDTPAKARTSNLNQDLGQIEYVFSDKTGTLTRNVMEFKQCAIGGRVYGRFVAEADDEEEAAEEATAAAERAPGAAAAAAGGSTPNLLNAVSAGCPGLCARRRGPMRAASNSPGGAPVASAAAGSLDSGVSGQNPMHSQRGMGVNGSNRSASSGTASSGGDVEMVGVSHRANTSGSQHLAQQAPAGIKYGVGPAKTPKAGAGSGFDDALLIDALARSAAGGSKGASGARGPAAGGPQLEPSADPMTAFDVSGAEAFFTCMAVCHTVVPESEPGSPDLIYQAESPDEAALTKAAKDAGFEFRVREADHIVVRRHAAAGGAAGGPAPGSYRDLRYDVFGVHDFNSTRKRMSLVAQDPSGRVLLMCKGADNVMFDRAVLEPTRGDLETQLTAFASKGLRTLVLGWREMSQPEFQAWRAEHTAASVALSGREEALAAVAEKYEVNFTVLGATAIEDRLQAGVPGTIRDLARAGIKTWVLTGDKVETAINIGFSCRLLDDAMELITLTSENSAELRVQLAALEARFAPLVPPVPAPWHKRLFCGGGDGGGKPGLAVKLTGADGAGGSALHHAPKPSPYRGPEDLPRVRDTTALVMTGPCLTHILDSPDMEDALLTVAKCCRAVIACRVSPQQKAKIVHLVRRRVSPRPMTLAIGDGANDVGMIQRAEVGVGISGKEGLQAVNAADFAIAQFRFLRRLLLVHGRWDYRRMTKVVLYSFYKNVVITFSLFYFTALTGFSGTSMYESLVYSAYNFVLGLPIIFIGITERDVPAATALAHPAVYAQGRLHMDLNPRRMAAWLAQAVAHSAIVFWIPYGVYGAVDGDTADSGSSIAHAGQTGLSVAGLLTFSCLVWGMTLKVAFETLTWTYLNVIMVAISMAGYYVFILAYSQLSSVSPDFYGVAVQTLCRSSYWLTLALVLGSMVVLELTVMTLRAQFAPRPVDIARELAAGYGTVTAPGPGGKLLWGDEEPTHAQKAVAAAAKHASAGAGAQPKAAPVAVVASPIHPPAAADPGRSLHVQRGVAPHPHPQHHHHAQPVSPPGERRLSATALAVASSSSAGVVSPPRGGPLR